MLQAINSSPGNITPVLDLMVQKAMELCDAACGSLMTHKDGVFELLAHRGLPEAFVAARQGPRNRGSIRVTANYRITFGWSGKSANNVDLEDYH